MPGPIGVEGVEGVSTGGGMTWKLPAIGTVVICGTGLATHCMGGAGATAAALGAGGLSTSALEVPAAGASRALAMICRCQTGPREADLERL